MGQTLSEPITEKHSSQDDSDSRCVYAYSSMQGWRLCTLLLVVESCGACVAMEDAHVALTRLPGCPHGNAFFAVFDGHGGDRVAKYAGETLHSLLVGGDDYRDAMYKEALIRSFLQLDEELLKHPDLKSDPSGATAVACLVTRDKLVCSNAGDSRCIISIRGKAQTMSNDHKPTLKTEQDRIKAAGGFVEFGRVNGNLALSRAVGDFEFKANSALPAKDQIVTVYPEIIEHTITTDTDFIVLACDGIWDCMDNQRVVDFVQAGIVKGHSLQQVCEDMLDACLAPEAYMGGVGCDNMTVIIVGLLHGQTKEEWVARIAKHAKEVEEMDV